jgi:hypothetical protein
MDAAKHWMNSEFRWKYIDVQAYLPFDIQPHHCRIIKKTPRYFCRRRCTGRRKRFMLQKVIEEQDAYRWLDSQPRTIAHTSTSALWSTAIISPNQIRKMFSTRVMNDA